ncbi:MAG TPA: hypothetical protein VGO26_04330 [Amnibacterium sp.]|nr:hypothetical protein [Amnibacterium sp.]
MASVRGGEGDEGARVGVDLAHDRDRRDRPPRTTIGAAIDTWPGVTCQTVVLEVDVPEDVVCEVTPPGGRTLVGQGSHRFETVQRGERRSRPAR